MSSRPTLTELQDHGEFARRHIGPDPGELAAMLATIGVASLDELMDRAVPERIRQRQPLDLPAGRSEREVLTDLRALAERNEVLTSLIGMGYYGTVTPPVIQRNLLENPAWYTAYTPYQPEISQGRLEALLNFQTMVADLTGLDLANASMLDEATAAAEAMTMARRLSKSTSDTFVVDPDTHPQTIAVLRTRAEPVGIDAASSAGSTTSSGCFGALLSYPGSSGAVADLEPPIDAVHDRGGLAVVASDLLALVLLSAPGRQGADIVVGSAQRFGVPMGFGGPHAAFLATRDAYARSLPGRLVGVSTDTAGRPALRLALQTREQHIRREKATSNICTAQVLLANIAGMYAVWHGPDGLTPHRRAGPPPDVHPRRGAARRRPRARQRHLVRHAARCGCRAGRPRSSPRRGRGGINLRPVDADTVGLSLDETTTPAVLQAVVGGVRPARARRRRARPARRGRASPPRLGARGELLTHPVFNRYHSEHELLRYLRRLADRDLALDRTMIPLGSCTMKLNATAEMLPDHVAGARRTSTRSPRPTRPRATAS